MQAYYISLVCQVKHGLLGAAGLSHQPRSSFPLIFTPSTLPLSLFFLLLFTSLIPVCLFLSSLVKTFSFEFTFKQQGAAHICTPRDTPQSSDFIVFIHTALRCRLSDDLENTKQSDDELLLHKQLPTTANASEVLQTCTSSKKRQGMSYRVC